MCKLSTSLQFSEFTDLTKHWFLIAARNLLVIFPLMSPLEILIISDCKTSDRRPQSCCCHKDNSVCFQKE